MNLFNELNWKKIRWYHWLWLWLLPTRYVIEDKKLLKYKNAFGRFWITGEGAK